MVDVSAQVSSALSEELDVPSGEIAPEKTLEELGVDSVAAVELGDVLQQRLGIRIGEDELNTQNTVAQVISVITGKVGAEHSGN
ncbi:acyl carrier protein [Halostreptopolyspora alba]|uniref:acyl carrier protein n=1 Tax=Halostreptopolyspora alba TaxID=2487137 RepID=UPI00267C8E18